MTEYAGEVRSLNNDLSILKNMQLEQQPVGIKSLFARVIY